MCAYQLSRLVLYRTCVVSDTCYAHVRVASVCSTAVPRRRYCTTPLDVHAYERAADDLLEHLADYLDRLPEMVPDLTGVCAAYARAHTKATAADYDVQLSQGVLNILLGAAGTYVLNKQTPNRQIWLSSPVSGPKRYDYVVGTGEWVYTHDNQPLHTLLTKEFRQLLRCQKIAFSLPPLNA